MKNILKRKRKRILIIAFLISLLILTTSGASVPLAEAHNPIFIEGNDALATFIEDEGLSGNGTSVSPYIIENFIIDIGTVTGILIRHTDAHLIIRDCSVTSGGYPSTRIHIFNATNVNISNNYISSGSHGIVLENSNNNRISGNTVNFADYGVFLLDSSNNILSKNTASSVNYGIRLESSSNNMLSENTANYTRHIDDIKSGVYLSHSSNNTLSGNNADYSGISLSYSCDNMLFWNTANGRFSGISLSHLSNNNVLSRNNASYNYYNGINLGSSNNNTITRNTAYYNGNNGIKLVSSSNNILSENNASYNNEYGIYLNSRCYDNTLSGNIVDNNYIGGIYIETPITTTTTTTTDITTTTTQVSPSWTPIIVLMSITALLIFRKRNRHR